MSICTLQPAGRARGSERRDVFRTTVHLSLLSLCRLGTPVSAKLTFYFFPGCEWRERSNGSGAPPPAPGWSDAAAPLRIARRCSSLSVPVFWLSRSVILKLTVVHPLIPAVKVVFYTSIQIYEIIQVDNLIFYYFLCYSFLLLVFILQVY